LFRELKDANIMHARQKDLTNFLKEFCSFAQALQPSGPQGRENFFKTLMANDVLGIIEPCITSKLPATRTATVELLTMIVDFNPQIFRDYLIKQARTVPENKNEDLLINKMINHILTDKDPELTSANQMAQVLRLLLDPENISTDTSTFFRDNERKFKLQKTDKSDFLVMFYKRAMYTLCKPIVDNTTGEKPVKDDYYTSNQAGLIIRLLCFCIDHHSYHMRSYVTQHNLLNSVLVLLRSKHHLLALSALRMVRRVVQLKDDIYLRHIRDKRVIDKVVDCFKENGPRYNLLNSALIEFFEFIRTEEIRALVEYTILNHWDTFKDVDYVKTFIQMKTRYDQYEHGKTKRESSDEKKPSSPPAIVNEQWKKEREYDNDEVFFNKDDEEDEEVF
jgi:protein phosphatase-4 regulatory subunit 3